MIFLSWFENYNTTTFNTTMNTINIMEIMIIIFCIVPFYTRNAIQNTFQQITDIQYKCFIEKSARILSQFL